MKLNTSLAKQLTLSPCLFRPRQPCSSSLSQSNSTNTSLRTISSTCTLTPRHKKTRTQGWVSPSTTCSFSRSSHGAKGLTPESPDPKEPNTQPRSNTADASIPVELSDKEYQVISDSYIETLFEALQEMAEDADSELEVDYSAGVLTLSTPKGTYVLNKQPPNKQIWLSSPISGPKRFDYVKLGVSQDTKEETVADRPDHSSGGVWTYLRDGSSLTRLLEEEVGVALAL